MILEFKGKNVLHAQGYKGDNNLRCNPFNSGVVDEMTGNSEVAKIERRKSNFGKYVC
jgi:hypothetical protein